MNGGPRLPGHLAELFQSLEASPDAVFATDRSNLVVAWNRAAERLLGYRAEEALGASCAALLGGCDVWGNRYCTESCPIRETAARGEGVNHFGLRFQGKDGPSVALDVSVLHLPAPPPHQFFLLHLLKPAQAAAPPAEVATEAPPRPALQQARESLDARARRLTQREVEILGMLAAGRATPEVASILHISTLTARNHIQNILEKLEVHSKAEAVAFAFQKRLF